MKILFISSRPLQINTSSSIRNRAYINGFVKLGHKVEVLSIGADLNHEKYESLNNSFDNKIKYIWLNPGSLGKIKSLSRNNILLKFLRTLGYKIFNIFSLFETTKSVLNSVNDLNIDINKFDLLISSSDPKSSHELALNLFKDRVRKIKWIQIWGDPFYSDITRNNKFLNKKIKKKEYNLLKKADKIIYVSHLTIANQKNLFPDFSPKMVYIPTPFIKEKLYDKKAPSNKLKFLYVGDYHSSVRNLATTYSVFSESQHQLNICGDSDEKFKEKENITIRKRVNYEESQLLQEDCDVLIHLSNLKGNQIPGKIFHYSATNKPILFILDGDKKEIESEFKKYKRYIFCNNDCDSIRNAVKYIVDNSCKMNYKPVKEFSSINCVQKLTEL